MALDALYALPSGTLAALNALRTAGALEPGALYRLTDDPRVAVATSASAYQLLAADVAVATAAEFRSNAASRLLDPNAVWGAAAFVTLTDATTIAVNMGAGINFQVTLGGNRTLGAPSGAKVGQSGVLRVAQDGTGGRTLSFNAAWKFAGGTAPTLTTTASAVDFFVYFVFSISFVLLVPLKDVK